jgi:FAD/FMN-containing dehydrogenase/Fe-S oxidoreductase
MQLTEINVDSIILGKQIRSQIKGDVFSDRVTRLLYSTDGSIYQFVPAVVVCPRDEDDVRNLVLFAHEHEIPITPRGAGTGLAGESLTTGILVDFTRYMTQIISVDTEKGEAVVQAGVILDEINRTVKDAGWQFGPDPSSGSRATVGGCLANNATGAHSLRYGYFSDNLLAIEMIASDGNHYSTNGKAGSEISQKVYQLLQPNRKQIEQFWPTVKRNRAGYNLKGALSKPGGDLLRLMAGSEGTLGIFTEAKVKLVPIPKAKVVLSANFDELSLSAPATNLALEFNPSAVESMDGALIRFAREASPQFAEIFPEDVEASLMIEFDADTLDEAIGRLNLCKERFISEFGSHVFFHDLIKPQDQKRHWACRKNAVPLLYRRPGLAKPIGFIEDVAVDPSRLHEYLPGVQAIFSKYGLDASFFGHAGSGEFHIRPYLDLRQQVDRKTLVSLAKDSFELAWSLGGTISGEHAVGVLRSWALRKQYGPVYELMEKVKNIFDPVGILNPGKIIVTETEPSLMNLRADVDFQPETSNSSLNYGDDSLTHIVDVCNGCGECKGFNSDQMMCPVFRAIKDEFSAPRAKANLLRSYMTGQLTEDELLESPAMKVIDSCLLCGNCTRECPSAVHIPQIVMELRALKNNLTKPSMLEKFFLNTERAEKISSRLAVLTNYFFAKKGMRKILEMVLGIDARRTMPAFAYSGSIRSIRKLCEKNKPEMVRYKAAWFVDLYARYHDLKLAEDIVKVCSKNGIELVVPDQRGCNMPGLAYGFTDEVRKNVQYVIRKFTSYINDVDWIISFEPTAVLCLKQEYAYLTDDPAMKVISNKVRDGCDVLWELSQKNQLHKGSSPLTLKTAYHTPCHLRQLQIGLPGQKLISKIDGVSLDVLPDNCCGLAGTFGLRKDHYDLASQISVPLRDALKKSHYDFLISECSSCRMQLGHLAHRPTIHPVQLLAKWYSM